MAGKFINTFTGKKLKLLEPRPEDIDIRDIARSTSNQCRFTGHCCKFYSIAQHLVLGSELIEDQHAKDFLLHDAEEIGTGDVSSPLKSLLDSSSPLKKVAYAIGLAIDERFGVNITKNNSAVDKIDKQLLVTEFKTLFPKYSVEEFAKDNDISLTEYPVLDIRIEPWHPDEAMIRFLFRFQQLFRYFPF